MQTIIRDFLQHQHKYAYFLTDYHSQAPNERPFKPLAITAKPGATPLSRATVPGLVQLSVV